MYASFSAGVISAMRVSLTLVIDTILPPTLTVGTNSSSSDSMTSMSPAENTSIDLRKLLTMLYTLNQNYDSMKIFNTFRRDKINHIIEFN